MGNLGITEVQQAGMKRVLVKFSGGLREPETVLLPPGASTFEILERMGLEGDKYFLSRGAAGTTFGTDEVIYPLVDDGDLLYVTPLVDAGK